MIVTICYFLKSVKSVFISVQCNTSLSKNCCTFNNCSLCDRLNLKKNRFVSTLWLAVHMISVVEQGLFVCKIALDNKALKKFFEFRIC